MTCLRIATLNCLNLANPGRSIYPGVAPYSKAEYRDKTRWLAGLIDQLNPDILLLQEVFHEQALLDVLAQVTQTDPPLLHCAPWADAQNTKPRLAMVWRRHLNMRFESIVPLPAGTEVAIPYGGGVHAHFSRPLLRAQLDVPGAPIPLTLFNVHLKSRRPEWVSGESEQDPMAWARGQMRALAIRAAEAIALRHYVIETIKHTVRSGPAPIIVAGDFNDGPEAQTTHVVAGTTWTPDPPALGAARLFNAYQMQTETHTPNTAIPFTVTHTGVAERIDHILVSGAFNPSCAGARARVVRVETLNEHVQSSATTTTASSTSAGVPNDSARVRSDHAAVCVAIEYPIA